MTDGASHTPNYAKQQRYARAHERLKLALEHGFYIEAAMICESVITDRLHSHLHWRVEVARHFTLDDLIARLSQKNAFRGKRPEVSVTKHTTLFALIMCIALDFDDFGSERCKELPRRLDQWRNQRNKIAHKIIYTNPSKKTYEEAFDEFVAAARSCAVEGKVLLADLSSWDQMLRRRHKKDVPTQDG